MLAPRRPRRPGEAARPGLARVRRRRRGGWWRRSRRCRRSRWSAAGGSSPARRGRRAGAGDAATGPGCAGPGRGGRRLHRRPGGAPATCSRACPATSPRRSWSSSTSRRASPAAWRPGWTRVCALRVKVAEQGEPLAPGPSTSRPTIATSASRTAGTVALSDRAAGRRLPALGHVPVRVGGPRLRRLGRGRHPDRHGGGRRGGPAGRPAGRRPGPRPGRDDLGRLRHARRRDRRRRWPTPSCRSTPSRPASRR